MVGSSTLTVTSLFVGKGGASVGTLSLSGGTITVNTGGTDTRVGGNTSADALARGTIVQTGGAIAYNKNTQIGAWGVGTYSQTGGFYVPTAGFHVIGRLISGLGTWIWAAGVLSMSMLRGLGPPSSWVSRALAR